MREESHLPRRCDRTLPRGAEGRGAPLRFSRPASAARAEGRDGQVQAHPKVELRVSADAQADMPSAKASGAICVQRFDDSLTSCNSHYVSHFAAFFIVARAKISIDKGGIFGSECKRNRTAQKYSTATIAVGADEIISLSSRLS